MLSQAGRQPQARCDPCIAGLFVLSRLQLILHTVSTDVLPMECLPMRLARQSRFTVSSMRLVVRVASCRNRLSGTLMCSHWRCQLQAYSTTGVFSPSNNQTTHFNGGFYDGIATAQVSFRAWPCQSATIAKSRA